MKDLRATVLFFTSSYIKIVPADIPIKTSKFQPENVIISGT